MCGQIVGLQVQPGQAMPTDWQGAPQCGEMILQTAPVADPNTGGTDWVGSIRDPRSGHVYRATIALDGDRHLMLHGYIGLPIFGETQTWMPYSGRTLAGCKLAAANGASDG